MKKILTIISIIIIFIGAYLGYKALNKPPAQSLYNLVSVEKGEIIQKVSVTGSIISDQTINLQFEISGKIKEIPAKVGDSVTPEQVLINLQNNELLSQVQSASASLTMAQARLNKVLEGTRPEEIAVYQAAVQSSQDFLSAAEVDITNAEKNLTDVKADADQDLIQAYDDAFDTDRSVYTKADNSLLVLNNIRNSYFNGSGQLSLNVQSKELIAKNNIAKAKTSLDKAEINNTQQNIDLALVDLKNSLLYIRDALAYTRSSMDDPTVSSSVTSADKTSIDAERTAADTALATITSVQQAISSVKITNQASINTAQATLDNTKKDLDTAKSNLQKAENELALKQAGSTKADMDLARAEVIQAQANLAQAQDRLNKTTLSAPISGIVTAINFELGETVSPSQVAVSLINANYFQIEANVSETDISKIKLDDEVVMTLDAFGPDLKFQGKITEINPAETVISGVIYYKIKAIFQSQDPRIKSGMTVNLDIITAKKSDVLYLPFYAIKTKNNHKYAEILTNDKIQEITISIGLEGETNVEITEGLTQGQQVIVGAK